MPHSRHARVTRNPWTRVHRPLITTTRHRRVRPRTAYREYYRRPIGPSNRSVRHYGLPRRGYMPIPGCT